MEAIQISASGRETGSSAARRLRREGNVPCVVYGHGADPIHISVPELSLHPLIYSSEMRTVDLTVDGDTYTCILKDIDFDPVSEKALHADFLMLRAGEKLTVTVSFHFVGTAAGQEEGGELVKALHEVDVVCLPANMPSYIEVDVTRLEIGDAIHIGEIEVEGVEILATADQTVASVIPPRAEEELEPVAAEELEEEELEVEAEEGEEPEAEASDDKTAAE